MIPVDNYDNGDDNYNINVSRYTSGDITYNYLNYKVDKIETNDNSIKYLYTSQVKKKRGTPEEIKENKFVLEYISQDNSFLFKPVSCSLDVLMFPSVLVHKDMRGNLTDSINTLRFELLNETLQNVEFLFKCLCFQSGLSNLSKLFISCDSIYTSNIETIILEDNYFDSITLANMNNLKYVSPLKGGQITIYNCNNVKNLTIDRTENLTINNMNELNNITINKAEIVVLYDLPYLKSCIGKSVDSVSFGNIYDLADADRETKLFDFRNTEKIVILDSPDKIISIKECFFNSLVPELCYGSSSQTVSFEHLHTTSIFWLDTTGATPVYKPLFGTTRSKTYIEVLTFTGGDDFYNDPLYDYESKYNPECVITMNFTNFYCNINQPAQVKAVYRKLFDGPQNQEVYINAPIMFPAHWFDN